MTGNFHSTVQHSITSRPLQRPKPLVILIFSTELLFCAKFMTCDDIKIQIELFIYTMLFNIIKCTYKDFLHMQIIKANRING